MENIHKLDGEIDVNQATKPKNEKKGNMKQTINEEKH